MTPFDIILQILKFLASTVCKIIGGPKIPKLGHVTPQDPFDPILHFFSLELTAIRLRAKFEVSGLNRSRDNRGSLNSKIGLRDPHMTPFDPILHFSR